MSQMDVSTINRSVWSLVDEVAFHSQVRDLHDRCSVANTAAASAPPRTSDSLYLLSPTSERRLANDIAFLAACQPAGEHVVAATIEATLEKRRIKFSLAANRGIIENVEVELNSVFKCLERRARKGYSPNSLHIPRLYF